MISGEARATGTEALARLDRLLLERPQETHAELTLAVRGIVQIRDLLIERRRAGDMSDDAQDRLGRMNRLVSTAISAQFPVTGMHWDRVEKTRDGLRSLLDTL